MIKINLYELDKHRNETTFRPFLLPEVVELFKEVGIQFTTTATSYDYAFVGQASIVDKSKSLKESVDLGLEYVSKITGDYFILDGQDSTSLIGTIDVFRDSNAKLFLKNTYLKDFDLYKKSWANGRMYWGEGDYSVPDIDELKPRMKLTGCNWLSTLGDQVQWYDFVKSEDKQFDISCMFGYKSDETHYEYGNPVNNFYEIHRKELLEKCVNTNHKVVTIKPNEKVDLQTYFNTMLQSKIITSPFGYGEMNPRDVHSAMCSAVLLEPDMSHISSKPFIYEEDETYISVKYDLSNLEEKIDYILSDYDNIRERLVNNMRKKYDEEIKPEKIVLHFYNLLKNLDGVVSE